MQFLFSAASLPSLFLAARARKKKNTQITIVSRRKQPFLSVFETSATFLENRKRWRCNVTRCEMHVKEHVRVCLVFFLFVDKRGKNVILFSKHSVSDLVNKRLFGGFAQKAFFERSFVSETRRKL